MASNLGTVFVELQLDDKIYRQKLSDIQPHAVATAKGVETAWRALGTKSTEAFDAQRRAAENAYTLIKKSALTTTQDIVRAEEAKNAKIKQLNEQQYGHQTTMLEGLKKNWLAAAAVIGSAMIAATKAWDLAKMGAGYAEQEGILNNLTQKYKTTADEIVKAMARASAGMIANVDLMEVALGGIAKGMKPEQMIKLAEAAALLGDTINMGPTEALKSLSEALESGRMKGLKSFAGATIDLGEAFGDLESKLTETERAQAMYFLMMQHYEGLQKQQNKNVDEAADKIDRMEASYKNAKLAAAGFFKTVIAGIYDMVVAMASVPAYDITGMGGGVETPQAKGKAAPAAPKVDPIKEAKDGIEAIRKMAKARLDAEEKIKKAAGGTEADNKAKERLIDEKYKHELALAKAVYDAEEDMIRDVNAGTQQTLSSIKQIEDQLERNRKRDVRIQADFYEESDPFGDKAHAARLALIDEYAAAFRAAKIDEVDIEQWAADEKAKIEYDLFKKKTDYLSQGFGDLSNAFDGISKMYAEGSEDAKKWQQAADAMLIAQKAVAVVQAVVAIATQGSGDPYTAFARIAAMAAAMGALLATIGESVGGGGAAAAAPKTYNYGGDAGPLGAESGTASESISNSYELLKDTYELEDTKLTKIYNELRNLNSNITGLVSSIFRTKGVGNYSSFGLETGIQESGASEFWNTHGMMLAGFQDMSRLGGEFTGYANQIRTIGMDFGSMAVHWAIDKLSNWVVNGVFGGETETTLEKGGIELSNVIIKNVLSGMSVSARQYATYKTEEDGGWFHSDKTSWETKYASLDSDVVRMLTKVFDNLGGSLVELAKGLGTDVQAVYNYVFKETQLNLKGMNADEMSKALTEYFSKIADTASSDLFGTIIKQYQEVNEALFETAVRLVNDKAIVEKVLEMTNQSFNTIDTSTVRTRQVLNEAWTEWDKQQNTLAFKMKAFAANASKEMYLALGQEIPAGLQKILDDIIEPTKYLTETYVDTTSKVITLTESLIEMAGGLEELTDAFQTYYDAFFSDAEKQADIKKQLTAGLGQYGMSLPDQRDDYRALVESLNLTTDAGQAAYVALMQMSKSADTYYDYLEQKKSAIKESDYATRTDYLRAVNGYAEGGIATGSSSGYEATLHGTELVVSPRSTYPATVKGLSNDEVVKAIKELKAEVGQGTFYSKANSDKIVKILDRWEAIGPHAVRT